MTTYATFAHDLVAANPALQPVLEEHLEDNFGEVLPHLFLDAVRRWALDHVSDHPDLVQRVCDRLEESLASGDPDIRDLVGLSFLEDLPGDGAAGAAVIDLLGPALRTLLRMLDVGS